MTLAELRRELAYLDNHTSIGDLDVVLETGSQFWLVDSYKLRDVQGLIRVVLVAERQVEGRHGKTV